MNQQTAFQKFLTSKFIFLFVLIFAAFLFPQSTKAADVTATIRPDINDYCTKRTNKVDASGKVIEYEYYSSGTTGYVGACIRKGYKPYNIANYYYACPPDTTFVQRATNVIGCLPNGMEAHNIAALIFGCPQGFQYDAQVHCFDPITGQKLKDYIVNIQSGNNAQVSPTSQRGQSFIYWYNTYTSDIDCCNRIDLGKIASEGVGHQVDNTENVFGCFARAYACPYRPVLNQLTPNTSHNSLDAKIDTAEIIEAGLFSNDEGIRCAASCKPYGGASLSGNSICIPQTNYGGNIVSGWSQTCPADNPNCDTNLAFQQSCDPSGFLKGQAPADLTNAQFFQSCGTIIYDGVTGIKKPDVDGALATEFNKCVRCEYIIDDIDFSQPLPAGKTEEEIKTFYLWTGAGCVDPTPTGLVTRVMQIGVGIMGFIIIARILQLILMLNDGEDNPDKFQEVQNIALSIVGFVVFTLGAVAVLRFLGYNILQIDIPLFNP